MNSVTQRYRYIYKNIFKFSGSETQKDYFINSLICYTFVFLIAWIGFPLALSTFLFSDLIGLSVTSIFTFIYALYLLITWLAKFSMRARRFYNIGISRLWLIVYFLITLICSGIPHLPWIVDWIPEIIIMCLPANLFFQIKNASFKNILSKDFSSSTNKKEISIDSESLKTSLIESEISQLEQELYFSYIQIGKKVMEHTLKTNIMPGIDIANIIEILQPQIQYEQKLKKELLETKKEIHQREEIKKVNQLHKDFEHEKEKLAHALALEIISQQEYENKLNLLKKRIQYFDKIKKIEKQFELKLISKSEMDIKINQILSQ